MPRETCSQRNPPGGRAVPESARGLRKGKERPTGERRRPDQPGEAHQRGSQQHADGRSRAQPRPGAARTAGCSEAVTVACGKVRGVPDGIRQPVARREGFKDGPPMGPDLAPGRAQRMDHAAGHGLRPRDGTAAAEKAEGLADTGAAREELARPVPRILRHQADEQPDNAADDGTRCEERHRPKDGVLQSEVDLRAACCAGRRSGVRRGPEMPYDGGRHHHDPVAGEPVPPAEIDVVAHARQRGIEPAQLIPCAPQQQHAGGADSENVTAAVMLPLVELIPVDER